MICALLLGREGSSGFPGKNVYPVLGRPMVTYPLVTAKACELIDRVYISTDSPKLKEIAANLDCHIIDRPAELASKTALGEHAYVHGYEVIRDQLAEEGHELELVVLLFANAPTVTPEILREGIEVLRAQPETDSAVSVSKYNMWSPLRARRQTEDGHLEPFVPFETFGDPATLNCDRDSQGDVWFADMGTSIVRPSCLENLDAGLLPQKWMGQKIYPLKQWGGCDVDEPWQIPAVEAWLQAHQIDRLFQIPRTRWEHYYDSERAILSRLDIGAATTVLDHGPDAGSFGIALRERFGVENYTAVVSNPARRAELQSSYPDLAIQDTEPDTGDCFDLVVNFSAGDEGEGFDEWIGSAYARVAEGGSLVFGVRLTERESVLTTDESYQTVVSRSVERQVPYRVYNASEVVEKLRPLNPESITGFGYSGNPSSTATTPYGVITFAVFQVRKDSSASGGVAELYQLPEILKDQLES